MRVLIRPGALMELRVHQKLLALVEFGAPHMGADKVVQTLTKMLEASEKSRKR